MQRYIIYIGKYQIEFNTRISVIGIVLISYTKYNSYILEYNIQHIRNIINSLRSAR